MQGQQGTSELLRVTLDYVTSSSQWPHEVNLILGGHRGSEKLANGAESPQLAQFKFPSSPHTPQGLGHLLWSVGVGAEKGRP